MGRANGMHNMTEGNEFELPHQSCISICKAKVQGFGYRFGTGIKEVGSKKVRMNVFCQVFALLYAYGCILSCSALIC